MSVARKLGKRAAPVEKRYFVANMRSPASPRIGTVSLWLLGMRVLGSRLLMRRETH